MFYYLAKYISKIALRVNFRKIFIHYREPIPKDKPIIFAANHPTAFLDPVILGAFFQRPTHFIVRGDVFKGRIVLALLNGLKMLPIFRFRDGYAKLKNNQATMETVYQKLAEKRCVLVLAEGETKHEKRMRPIQKGTARMAFGALEAHGKIDVVIIPVGVNYTDSDAFRSQVMVEVGRPISLKDYAAVQQENPRKAIKQVTDRIQKEMREMIIHVEDEANDQWINRLLDFYRNDRNQSIFPMVSSDSSLFESEFGLVEKINNSTEENVAKLKKQVTDYDAALAKAKVTDRGVSQFPKNGFGRILLLIIGFFPFLFGYVFNYVPMKFAKNLADQKVKKIEFYSSVRYGAGMVAYLIYLVLFLVIAAFVGHPLVWGMVLMIPVFGFIALKYMDLFSDWNEGRKFGGLDNEQQKRIIELRREVVR